MTDTSPWTAPNAWARHLAAPALAPLDPLNPAEARRVRRYRDRLLAAVRERDRAALHRAKQAVLQAAYARPGTPALRRALRLLAWHMAALLPPRRGTHSGI